jgi:hypothetical protein
MGDDIGKRTDDALEERRLYLQAQRDAMHDEMHAIVREQERRRTGYAVLQATAHLSLEDRQALLASLQGQGG